MALKILSIFLIILFVLILFIIKMRLLLIAFVVCASTIALTDAWGQVRERKKEMTYCFLS